ncbi:MAG: hypothetical protein KC546_10040 [Anaerolineae bacterium]|nr:hypothetical protein [Anaerolineae bacterium]
MYRTTHVNPFQIEAEIIKNVMGGYSDPNEVTDGFIMQFRIANPIIGYDDFCLRVISDYKGYEEYLERAYQLGMEKIRQLNESNSLEGKHCFTFLFGSEQLKEANWDEHDYPKIYKAMKH